MLEKLIKEELCDTDVVIDHSNASFLKFYCGYAKEEEWENASSIAKAGSRADWRESAEHLIEQIVIKFDVRFEIDYINHNGFMIEAER